MKTTTIGRIGTIVAGAAMLGTAVASALAGAQTVPANLDKGFFYDANMNPIVQAVIGEKAQAPDGAAAGKFAAVIGNMAYNMVSQTESETVTVDGGTVTCPGLSGVCGEGVESGEGEVTLSWEATGLVADLEQREMDCYIYDNDGMQMSCLDDGGDVGGWCCSEDDYLEQYFPEDTVSTRLVGVCDVGTGAEVTILQEGEYANEICTICYNYCDIALGCEPHMMTEWVDIQCENLDLEYDCEDGELRLMAEDEAIIYNVFTDDLLTKDIQDDDDVLVGQSYLGQIILGQHEYFVKELDEDEITIVCGASGTATTSVPMEYTPPAEGSACMAADSGETYSIRLVGAQTIEEVGVVDVTLEVTKPDGSTEQVTTGVSGIPKVGDIEIKLQRGTAASNVITGEQSFSADLLIWYLPSEYTFEEGEQYTEAGVEDNDGIWELEFNGGVKIEVAELDELEDDEELIPGVALPDEISENDHYDDCYDEATKPDNETEILRYLSFVLQFDEADTELAEGEMIQLPFNDGMYLLSDLQFGYMGLMNEDFLADDMIDSTVISVKRSGIDVYNDTGDLQELSRKVEISFTDECGDGQTVRLDEGPFQDGDSFFYNGNIVTITDVEREDGFPMISFEVQDDCGDPEVYDDDENPACVVDTDIDDAFGAIGAAADSLFRQPNVDTDVDGYVAGPGFGLTECDGLDELFIFVRNDTPNDEDTASDWEIWIDQDGVGDMYAYLADTGDNNDATDGVDTEFEDDVSFWGDENTLTITGNSDTGVADDDIVIDLVDQTWIYFGCSLSGHCEDIADGTEDGTLVHPSGAIIEVESCEVEDPEDSEDEDDVICEVTVTIPEDKLRPTLFFGTSATEDTQSITITDSDVGTVVNIGGVDVTVESFGVVGSVAAGTAIETEESVMECPDATDTCDVTYETASVNPIGYSLVVVEGQQTKQNLVLIGGPAVLSMAKDLTTAEDLKAGPKLILSGNKLLAAGYEAADTAAAVDALIAWLKSVM